MDSAADISNDTTLAAAYGTELNRIVAKTVRHGLDFGKPLQLDIAGYPTPLHIPRATFVTLEHDGRLRGCVGTIEAYEPLPLSVARYAHAAAFHDHRFDPVDETTWGDLSTSISILSPRETLHAPTEVAARAALRPGQDGVILSARGQRAVLLPQVWDDLPDPAQFLAALKRKAGLPGDFWSEDVQVERFVAVSVASAVLRSFNGNVT